MRPRLAAALALAAVPLVARPTIAQDVAYEKTRLPNGLTVILYEDHTLPVGAVNLWYRVGSKDEPARRSGFAHLFEHLMFMGTKQGVLVLVGDKKAILAQCKGLGIADPVEVDARGEAR